MAAMSVSTTTTTSLFNPDAAVKYDLIAPSPFYFPLQKSSTANNTGDSNSSLRKAVLQQRLHMSSSHRLPLPHSPLLQHALLHQIQSHSLKKTQSSSHLAGKLQDIMSNPLLIAPLKVETATTSCQSAATSCQSYVYTAPCEHHPSKGQTDYLVNDMFPKLKHDLSTIEFGIRIADFMPLAFKTVSVAGMAEKELQLLRDLGDLPNVIQLQDSFVNDNGDTVLVLPMLKKFECHAIHKSLCSIRKATRQVLTGLAAIHAKNIVHLDINPSNLMVTHSQKEVVIIDFGLSMTVDRHPKDKATSQEQIPVCGTTGYIAPEVMNPMFYESHDPTAADLYSLGVVLGEMLEPYIPDCDLHYFGSKLLTLENTNQTVNLLEDFIRQEAVYPRVLVQAADLLKNMLQEDPRDRKSAQGLLETHPFLIMMSGGGSATATATTGVAKLELCDWMFRVQEIKYHKYLYQMQDDCEVYRYR
ncbi:hypothetical protein BGZ65_007734 [Modicella reniformis]|uniref:Protein kinase domain-containing protein n=1 Tax=Modicella reniformis TaxID=1440133 RepID=A0A9P6IP72_9FUNG|nr:hypothetical protein BGZ65_007734 [Modicella reniformis]